MKLYAKTYLIVLAAFVCWIASAPVQAQGWLEDRDRAEGPGFRAGDLEIHPGVGAEIGYDSNVFLSSDDIVDPAQGSAILRVTPHLFLSTLSGERMDGAPPNLIDFRTGVSASLYHYFSTDQSTNVALSADLQLGINRGRPVALVVFGDYRRTIRPFTEDGAIDDDYARDQISAGGRLELQTKGGVLKGHAGYTLRLDYFEGTTFQFANSVRHDIQAGVAYKFLPSTALLYDANLVIHGYTSDRATPTELSNNVRMRTRVGLNGAITESFSFLAMVGYSAGFYNLGDDFDTIVAQLQATFRLMHSLSLKVGYDRDAYRSFVGGFYYRDRISAGLSTNISGALLLGLDLYAAHYDFGQTFTDGLGGSVGNSFDRKDWRLGATLFAEYRFTDYFGLNASLEYTGRFTDYEYLTGSTVLDPAAYNRFTAWLGARVFY